MRRVPPSCPGIDFPAVFQEKYLQQHWNNNRGFLYLAISHSFPYVLLLWAMLLSAAASLIFGLDAGGVVMLSGFLLLVLSAVATALVIWHIETDDLAQVFGNCKSWYLHLLRNAILQLAGLLDESGSESSV